MKYDQKANRIFVHVYRIYIQFFHFCYYVEDNVFNIYLMIWLNRLISVCLTVTCRRSITDVFGHFRVLIMQEQKNLYHVLLLNVN